MSLEIAWKQNILVTDSNLLKSLLVVFGFGLQAFVCEFSRQNICSVRQWEIYMGQPQNKYTYQNRAFFACKLGNQFNNLLTAGIIRMRVLFEGGSYMRKYGIHYCF